MRRYLTIHVRAHEGRYHGDGDDSPSPFRLFQALVAGIGISGPLDDDAKSALAWLEGLPDAPIIAAPCTIRGQSVSMFMPNNDLDAKGGDARRIGEIRLATKVWSPRLSDAKAPWVYAWPFAEVDESHANAVCALSERLYQLGRGVDMAWAWGELLDESVLEERLAKYEGVVRRPSPGDDRWVACPHVGSLKSLERRYQARRFRHEGGRRVFVQPPKPSYRQLAYESPPALHFFELRSTTDPERRVAWPLTGASSLVVAAREAARARLCAAMPDRTQEISSHLVGRKPDGSNAAPASSRVRIVPIPSIGMHYADRGIRRLLVEVPAACPFRSEDIRWGFSGVELFDPGTGELKDVLLSASSNDDMLDHYGAEVSARIFRTVTPVALPQGPKRRRLDPARAMDEGETGIERRAQLDAASGAVVQALRHADVHAPVDAIRVQREPFEAAGERAETFAEGTRFPKERLWHVEIRFGVAVKGPLVIGDGRFLGLGIMAPSPNFVPGAHVFDIVDGLAVSATVGDVTRALRRAVMTRVQIAIGPREKLDSFFSGHGEDGGPARSERAPHLAFAFEPASKRLLVVAPHKIERRLPTGHEIKQLHVLDAALEGFLELLAGAAGRLAVRAAPIDVETDPIFGRSHEWVGVTPYVVNRHARKGGVAQALADDLHDECRRRGLPVPNVNVLNVNGVPGVGLAGLVRLTFSVAVAGPILLGKSRHLGGGLFTGEV